jgi:1-acyl-sn-glycerol-3-phosphate acyltransferase
MFPIAVITRIITFPFDPKLMVNHVVSCVWGSLIVWLNPLWSVTFIGREKIKASQPYVIISNHQSYLDILVLYGLFKHFKWVSKKDIFKIPVVGWNMSLNKYVAVNRSNKFSSIKMMNDCEAHLRRGSSINIFPEGTRSKDGEIHAFKEGAFRLALAAKVPIVPIVLDGTLHGFPRNGIIFDHRCRVVVKVLDPIPYEAPYEAFANLPAREIAVMAYDIMFKELKGLRGGMK